MGPRNYQPGMPGLQAMKHLIAQTIPEQDGGVTIRGHLINPGLQMQAKLRPRRIMPRLGHVIHGDRRRRSTKKGLDFAPEYFATDEQV